jgi:hypothetical protein
MAFQAARAASGSTVSKSCASSPGPGVLRTGAPGGTVISASAPPAPGGASTVKASAASPATPGVGWWPTRAASQPSERGSAAVRR